MSKSVKFPKNCLKGGDNCNINKGCPSYKTPTPSEVAWDARMTCNMKGGDIKTKYNVVVDAYLDAIKFAVDKINLVDKVKQLTDKDFKFYIELHGQMHVADKEDFVNYILDKRDLYISLRTRKSYSLPTQIKIFFYKGRERVMEQIIEVNPKTFKIISVTQQSSSNNNSKQKGGQGYYYAVGVPPVAGQPVVKSYLDASRPYFPRNNYCGGKKQTGGTGSNATGYYFAVDAPHIDRMPQYRAYRPHNTPAFLGEIFNCREKNL